MSDLIHYIENTITQKFNEEIIYILLQFDESAMTVTRYFKCSFYVVNVSIYIIFYFIFMI